MRFVSGKSGSTHTDRIRLCRSPSEWNELRSRRQRVSPRPSSRAFFILRPPHHIVFERSFKLRHKITTHASQLLSCPPSPSTFLFLTPLVSCPWTTLTDSKPLSCGSRTPFFPTYFCLPFVHLHIFNLQYRHPRGRLYYTKARLADRLRACIQYNPPVR